MERGAQKSQMWVDAVENKYFIPKIVLVKSSYVFLSVNFCCFVSHEGIIPAQKWVTVLCKI